jgi:Cu/Ag efflux protein CusF
MTLKSNRLSPFAAVAAVAVGAWFATAPLAAEAQGMKAGAGNAQSITKTVTVKSVDQATRHLEVTDAAGDTYTLKAPAAVRNFNQIKPGDKIKAHYAIETEYILSSPNSPLPANSDTTIAARAAKGELPAGVVANHTVVTGNVLGIDTAAHTIKIVNKNGGQVHTIYVRNAERQKLLPQVKVGDTITAYVTEALLITVTPA